ncbi:fumarate hydratase [bacterium]|nr:fumarate hydratase [bacterium]
MRQIDIDAITKIVKNLCIEANYFLSPRVLKLLKNAYKNERENLSKQVLSQIIENCKIASKLKIPLCQDTGMVLVFIEIGAEIKIKYRNNALLNNLEAGIQEGVRRGYKEGYLRKSVVDPLTRENTQDNTPAIIYTRIVPGDKIKITLSIKGFGCENMGKVKMFTPAAGNLEIKKFIVETVKKAGANPCPPIMVGVGIGGTMDKAVLMAKGALVLGTKSLVKNKKITELERECLKEINKLNIGPAGLGGKVTALGVYIKTHPTHIAGLPVAVNISCWANRYREIEI